MPLGCFLLKKETAAAKDHRLSELPTEEGAVTSPTERSAGGLLVSHAEPVLQALSGLLEVFGH